MPHAPWCTRDRRPSLAMRLRYGALAKAAMAAKRPCATCETAHPACCAIDQEAMVAACVRAVCDGVIDGIAEATASALSETRRAEPDQAA
jgi:hypothetical protein